jgi:phosphoribosylpyrophosphate synthetase
MKYIYLARKTKKKAGATMVVVMDFEQKEVQGCFKIRMSLIFWCFKRKKQGFYGCIFLI